MSDIVLITSVIHTGVMPWSYAKDRSVFSPEERFRQTLETIESVRKFLPEAGILLVECSPLTEDETQLFQSRVDFFINVYENEEIRNACLYTKSKGIGEAMKTRFAIDYIVNKGIGFRRLFKLSGRYLLTQDFQEKLFALDTFTFKKRIDEKYPQVVSNYTVLFSTPFHLLGTLYHALNLVIEFYKQNEPIGYEELLPLLCEPKHLIEKLGVQGYVAVTQNDFFTA
jgi:hypothetical protein